MKSLTAVVWGSLANKSRKPLSHRSMWGLIAMALAATLLIAIPAFADCAEGSVCTVVIGNTQYVVVGFCNYSTLGTPFSSCIIESSTPAGPALCVGGSIPCPSPNSIVQDPAGQPITQAFEQDARQHIAALRGIPDDSLNVFWSRGEIRAYMYLHLLGLANAPAGTLSTQDQAVVNYYDSAINAERLAVSTEALSLYNSWTGNPCTFQVPVGDPNAYLNQQATQFACLQGSANECAIVNCIVPAISADQFNAWAAGFVLQKEINEWGQLLIDGPYIGLTLPKAQGAAGLEYDTSFGGVEEGVGFLTANHAQIANIASNAEIAAQSDLQAQWLEGLHDFAGERLEDTMINSIAAIASSELSGNEATLAQIFGVETAFSVVEDAVEESALGTASASWDTFVGPAIAAVAAIGVESWELANAAGVQPQLQAAVCAVAATATNGCPGTTLETLPQYAQDPNGRQLILDALIKSTMPDYIVARLGDPTYGSAPSAGPVVLSDPNFAQGSHPPTASFTSTGWSGNSNTASVADGWFVMSANTSTGPGALRYTSNIPYLTPSALNSTVGGTTTITPINVEQWRAWLDGQNFLAQRAGIQAGFGQVEDAVNACPTVVVGGGGSVTATVIDLGNICVKVSSEPFPVQKGDEIVIGGQVRTAAGNEFFNQSDGNYYIQTTEAFENPPPAAGPITVLVHPDGNCLTSSALGSRVSTPDCTSGPTINTDHGVVTIVPPTPTATFSLAGLGSITFGGPAFNVANFFVSNSSGVVTFSLAGRSVGCTVTSNGTVTLTGAAAGADSCIIIALQAASAGFGTAAPLSGSFHINQATPTVSITGGAFGFNGSPRSASGFAYGLGGVADVQSPAVTFSYVGTNGTNYAAGSIAPTYPGSYQVTANFVGNANYATASAVATITINSATTVVTMNSPAAVQYSDRTTLSASVSPASLGTQAQSGTVQFYLKGAAVGSPQAINSAGVATLSGLQVTLAESSYAVKAVFTSANSDFAGGNASATQQINPENAFLSYTGDMIGQVGTSLNLRATVWDSAAAGYSGINPESAATATIGDITKMWVAFDVYPVGSCAIGTPGTLYAPVTLTPTAGIGTAAVTLSSASEISDCVVARLVAGSAGGTNQFYIAPNAPTAGVDFYVNSGQFATGGGWINDPTGSHGNFAFNGRYNSSGSPKGQISYMYQAPYNGVAANFVIQSNALSALQFTGTKDPISSTLQGKASVQIKRASDGVLLFSAGNYAFSATVTDSGLNGQSGKQFSLTVYGSNGVMFHVVPAATPLQGGNVVVHSAK